MYKGKYVLLPVGALCDKVREFLGTDKFQLMIDRHDKIHTNILLYFDNIKDEDKNADEIIKKILNNKSDDYIKIKSSYIINKHYLSFSISECSYMFSKIFYILGKVVFDDEVIMVNDEKDIYLFYKDVEK